MSYRVISTPTHPQYLRGFRTLSFDSLVSCGVSFNIPYQSVKSLIDNGKTFKGFFFDWALDDIDYDVEFKND